MLRCTDTQMIAEDERQESLEFAVLTNNEDLANILIKEKLNQNKKAG